MKNSNIFRPSKSQGQARTPLLATTGQTRNQSMYDSGVIMKDDLDRIKRESIVLTQADKRGLWAQDHEARQRLAKLSEDRRS
jgi:hypothetical protein